MPRIKTMSRPLALTASIALAWNGVFALLRTALI